MVTNTFNGRGLPFAVSSSASGLTAAATGALYNQLGQMTQLDLGNGLKTKKRRRKKRTNPE